jgi:hypothetical protein
LEFKDGIVTEKAEEGKEFAMIYEMGGVICCYDSN